MKTVADANTPFILRASLWFLILGHILYGVLKIILIFPFVNQESKNKHIKSWSNRLLKIFGIKLVVSNMAILPQTPFLLSANHISWMDIHVINAFKPIRFVAKSEVASWPIFGWMAKHLGTIFIRRDSSRHARQVVGEMSIVLRTQSICIFPEGTSTTGESVNPFKANLFESAVVSNVPVFSLAITYKSQTTGLRSEAAAFVGDMGLIESMARLLKARNLIAQLHFIAPPGSNLSTPNDRKWIALHSQESISHFIKYQ